jgi:hypothetical protein
MIFPPTCKSLLSLLAFILSLCNASTPSYQSHRRPSYRPWTWSWCRLLPRGCGRPRPRRRRAHGRHRLGPQPPAPRGRFRCHSAPRMWPTC